ncbi:hypothetical protein, partial [Clostridium sp.]|uniref:hypothetical protein n=1 Tax=Clostridium sp. TaxID=1506 RepID=UPI003F2B3E48
MGKLDFSSVDSIEKAMELGKEKVLSPLYLMPIRFNGQTIPENTVYVPSIVVNVKDRYDDVVEELLEKDKVDAYECEPKYKGDSFIPSS